MTDFRNMYNTGNDRHVDYLTELVMSDLQEYENIGLQFIKRNNPVSRKYISLSEALKSEKITINEVSDSGCVPELNCQNNSTDYILILAGEEIIGAKQNRIVNISSALQEIWHYLINNRYAIGFICSKVLNCSFLP